MGKNRNKPEAPIRIELDGPLVRIVCHMLSDVADMISAFVHFVRVILGDMAEIFDALKDRLIRHVRKHW
jgi:hypothetical protein